MTDYRKLTAKELDDAIMYQIQYGRDIQKLDHLLAARHYRESEERKA